MKSVSELARENFLHLKPCVHGADVWEAASKSGLKREDILDFSSSVNPLGPSQKALDAVAQSFGQIPMYPDSESKNLREAIAAHYAGLGIENVVVGNGSTELIYLFAEAFLQRGEIALIPAPSFGEYESAVHRAGGSVKYVPLGEDFCVDPRSFIQLMNDDAVKVVFLCNPNNPTSILCSPERLLEVVEAAYERDVLVFLDEDFLEFVENESALSLIPYVTRFSNLFVLRSFTKLFGLTGLRVGYGLACQELAQVLHNAKIPWNLNCLGQVAAVAALNDQEHLNQTLKLIQTQKTYLLQELTAFKDFKVYLPDANFIFIDIKKTGLTASELKLRMLSHGVLIRDCSSFAGLDEYYIRIAVKTHSENLKLINALHKTLNQD
ncbi:MAG: histidinol-phosphate transaminase [Candidatus Bathyarchaeota archaeon]|nr:histidinol-phosphate transaminase [Candidatus Bathyarchaeota archaeon]